MNVKNFRNILLLICIACHIVGCKPGREEKNMGYDLVCFTEYDDDGSSLKGVKRRTDGKIIVSPSSYASVTADSCFIIASKSAYSHEVWKTDGKYIGRFDTFTGFKRGFYVGTKYLQQRCIFRTMTSCFVPSMSRWVNMPSACRWATHGRS